MTMHLRDRLNRPYGTVVYNGTRFGYALCNERDHFSYDRGTQIALGRMCCSRKNFRDEVLDKVSSLPACYEAPRVADVLLAMDVLEKRWKRYSGGLSASQQPRSSEC